MAKTATAQARSFVGDLQRAHERIAAVASSTVESPWGAIEYVDRGEGTPIFVSHGVLGGHDGGVRSSV